jgi:hypothetical protein
VTTTRKKMKKTPTECLIQRRKETDQEKKVKTVCIVWDKVSRRSIRPVELFYEDE